MKAFIYTKDKESRKIIELHDVKSVKENKKKHLIIFYQGKDNEPNAIDTRYYKSTIYQN